MRCRSRFARRRDWCRCRTRNPGGCRRNRPIPRRHRRSLPPRERSTRTNAHGGAAGGGAGDCPLDPDHAPGKRNPNDCDAALAFLKHQDTTNSRQWYRSCLALVANAYGWGHSSIGTASAHAAIVKRAGKMHTNRTGVPRGAVLWWSGGAGHVAIYDGAGFIYSNDSVIDGEVSRVRWDQPEKEWGKHFEGWSAPYFPRAGGSVA